ncbi:hypothetical protein L596_024439 [Steinernema carpocapsae]|uniref:Rab proteins geranylgeranyltransferase component A n=1 Tax=Steinernema carpocapsae TaxID=34508 RepID=A0A4U5MGR4_STECR|nr:hypothetical protein L596_024439 [Steinernema carpocapsae]
MANHEELPSEVDVVVIGTGMQESILAAACARAGLSVLHIDRNPFYGGSWGSSFHFRNIEDWIQSAKSIIKELPCAYEPQEDEEVVPAAGSQSTIRNVALSSNVAMDEDLEEKENTTLKVLQWRKFSIDLVPKLLLSDGPMVKILRQSEASRYCEFQYVDRFLCADSDAAVMPLKIARVPCSKNEIAFSSILTSMEKRMLQKFLQFCMTWKAKREEVAAAFPNFKWEAHQQKPFSEFLASLKIKGTLKNIICEVIAVLNEDANTVDALEAVCTFLKSLGRMNNVPTPFLYTCYGSSELQQGFNRLCAVYGGVYCLDRPCEAFIINKATRKCSAIISRGQKITCKHVITSQDYIHEIEGEVEEVAMKRCILLTDGSIQAPVDEHISFLNLRRLNRECELRLIETGYKANVTPKGFQFVQLTSEGGTRSAVGDPFTPIFERLFRSDGNVAEGDERPRIWWSLNFDVVQRRFEVPAENIAVVPAPDSSLDFGSVVSSAEAIFARYWPDLDFLPRRAHQVREEFEEYEEEAAVREEIEAS